MKAIIKEYIENKYDKTEILKSDELKEFFILKDKETGTLNFCKIIKRKCEVYKKLKSISSPFFPKIYYLAYDDNETVIIEEYIIGETFREILNKDESISEKDGINIMLKICNALKILHKHNIVYRDLKPENVMLDINGNVKIIDFDAARSNKKNASSDTILLGTEGYAPPEQYGYSQTDKRADIHALGVMMYELLGKQKYKGKLKRILKKCVMFDPKNRYKNITTLKMSVLRKKYSKYAIMFIILFFMINEVNFILHQKTVRTNMQMFMFELFENNETVKKITNSLFRNNINLEEAWNGTYISSKGDIKAILYYDGDKLNFCLKDIETETVIIEGKAKLVSNNDAVYNSGDYELYINKYDYNIYIFDNAQAIGITHNYNFTGGYYCEA